MKNIFLVFALASLFAVGGCGNDDVVAPTGPVNTADDSFESQFPVNEDMPGVETEFAPLSKTPTGNLVETALANGFSTLVDLAVAADLGETLTNGGPFTVFAPTNEAFAALDPAIVTALLQPENQDKLQEILLYHVVAGEVFSRDLRFYQAVPSVEGSPLDIFRFFRLVIVEGVRVQLADVRATNGVIHVIDEVLIPDGFTLEDPAEPTDNLVETAVANGLSTLVDLAVAADLGETLANGGPFTVFAPTNEAFAALPSALVAELLLPENKGLLADILLYHVVEGQVLSSDLAAVQGVTMANGDRTLVTNIRGQVRVNIGSKVVAADVLASNGVAHVINRVLIPRDFYGLLHSLPQTPPKEYDQLELKLAEVR